MLTIGGYLVGSAHETVVHAQSHIDIKKAYGKCVGAYSVGQGVGLVFEDTNGDGRIDKWETYENGAIKTAAMDENGDGRPDRRLTYSGGALVLIESEPDASGVFQKRVTVK